MTIFEPTPVPADLSEQDDYDGMIIPLYALYRQIAAQGGQVIKGKTFTNCRIDGPSILLALGGVAFENCHFGEVEDDVKNLLVRPMGASKVTGCIPVVGCKFIKCNFYAVGFTGSEDFLDQFQAALKELGPTQ